MSDPATDPDRPAPRSLRAELTTHEMRERYRKQVLGSIGGWSGMAVTAVPTVVFVAVNAWQGLRWGVIGAVGVAVLLGVYRAVRHQPLQQAASGLGGVVIAAVIASATGHARDYFLWGIITSFAYAAAFAASMAVRRPVVGLIWEFLDPITKHHPDEDDVDPSAADPDPRPHDSGPPWYRHTQLLRAYQWATAAGVVVFGSRGVVQLLLYLWKQTGWLAVARVAMGYPLWIVALLFALWVVRRTRHRITPSAG